MGDIEGRRVRHRLAKLRAGCFGEPTNVNGRTNADVVVPWVNGTGSSPGDPRDMFIIDFGTATSEPEAAAYESTVRVT